MKKMLLSAGAVLLMISMGCAQDNRPNIIDYDPDKFKIVPDKVFEIGVPLLFLFLLLNVIVSVIKTRAANRLTERMIDKGISEDALIKIFKDQHAITKLQPLKWFLFTFATAAGSITLHLLRSYLINQSGYLAIGIILGFLSVAFLAYYRLLSKRI